MSLDQKGKNIFEIDDLNIKHCLNASLEKEGISVSEDLIKRTFDAIKKADDSETISEKHEIIKPVSLIKKTRILVSAAAAVAVLLVGMSAVRLLTVKKKADQNMLNGQSANMEIADKTSVASSEAAPESDDFMSALGYDDAAEKTDENNVFTDGDTGSETGDSGLKVKENRTSMGGSFGITSVQEELIFIDITSIEQQDVKSIAITDEKTGNTVNLTDRDQIDRFYSVLGNFIFIHDMADQAGGLYEIEIVSDNIKTRIKVGSDYIGAETVNNEMASYSVYSTSEQDKLIEELDKFIQE